MSSLIYENASSVVYMKNLGKIAANIVILCSEMYWITSIK